MVETFIVHIAHIVTKQNLDRFVCIVPPQLSELAKLKPLPDLTHLTVAENPVAQLPHYRQYLVFHLRTLEVLDSQPVTERDRHLARDRFEQGQCSQQRATFVLCNTQGNVIQAKGYICAM